MWKVCKASILCVQIAKMSSMYRNQIRGVLLPGAVDKMSSSTLAMKIFAVVKNVEHNC